MLTVVSPQDLGLWVNGPTPWLINGGDPNHLLTGMILQVGGVVKHLLFLPRKLGKGSSLTNIFQMD